MRKVDDLPLGKTKDQYDRTLRNPQLDKFHAPQPRTQPHTCKNFPTSGAQGQLTVGIPEASSAGVKGAMKPGSPCCGHTSYTAYTALVPLCRLLKTPVQQLEDILISDAANMRKHILCVMFIHTGREDLSEHLSNFIPRICTGNHELFRLICTLRSAHLIEDEFRTVLLLCPNTPTQEQFQRLCEFPDIYFMIGDPRKKSDLYRAGIVGGKERCRMRAYPAPRFNE